jgi:hypothetical protein
MLRWVQAIISEHIKVLWDLERLLLLVTKQQQDFKNWLDAPVDDC